MNDAPQETRRMSGIGTVVAVVVIFLIAGFLWMETANLRYPSDVFPRLVLVSTGVLGVLIICDELLYRRSRRRAAAKLRRDQINWVVTVLVATGIYVAVLGIIGFYATTWLFLVVLFAIPLFAGERQTAGKIALNLGLRAVVATGVTATIYGCFQFMLNVPTPRGLLF